MAPTPPPSDPPAQPRADPRARGSLTVPNALTIARIAGCGAMLWLAQIGNARAFVVVFIVLTATDWLDGKLAALLDQRTELGARLDSFADVIMYAALVIGVGWLQPDFLREESVSIGLTVGSYALSILFGFIRFGRMPAYHTRAAKTCWLLAAIGAITLLVGGPSWPARIALYAVIITNVEAIAITLVLKRRRTDVTSLLHALRTEQE